MSGGLYSTEGKDFDQTLDLKKIKPYGDTMNDGKTQLSFTLPVPAGDEAIEAAKQLLKKMGFENPQIVFHQELTEGYTFFNCYGNCTHTVDYSNIYVPKVESTKWDMAETDEFIREHIGRKIVVVGASTGTDAHTVGIDAIMNMKGFAGHYGIERYEMFERLEMRKPDSIAVKQYQIYKQAAGKTAKSILISVGVRLAAFNLKEIANLTCTDELDLASIGEKKVALFCCIPDADTSLNYLVGMIYSNLFQTLYYVADRKYGGRLPVPVHCIMDEWPNVALPDDFDKILATMRSRAISCSIIIQNMAQMKALFKDSWESLVGNCDEFLYLGGNEKEGHKYISELLGKETLDTNTYGQTKGRNGSYSTNYQQTGRELFTPDEIRLLDNRKAILFVRGERPMLDDKYNLKKHPNVKWTEDGGAPPYDYAKAPRSHDDLNIDIERLDDYELLCEEDILGKEQPF